MEGPRVAEWEPWDDETGIIAAALAAFIDDRQRDHARAIVRTIFGRLKSDRSILRLEQFALSPEHAHLAVLCFKSRIPFLTIVCLERNALGDAGVEPIAKALLDAPCLAELDLTDTRLVCHETPSLMQLIGTSTVLNTLRLTGNRMDAATCEMHLGPALSLNRNLAMLYVTWLPNPVVILAALRTHPTLKVLSIDRSVDQIDGSFAQAMAHFFTQNNVLETFAMKTTPCSEVATLAILRSLTYNTGLRQLDLGSVRGPSNLSTAGHSVLEAASTLLLHNVTLKTLPLMSADTEKELHRNKGRRLSRINRARQAVIALESLRRFRRSPCLRYIDRSIMGIVGRLIMASKLELEWEDPALWPKPWPNDPCYFSRIPVPASFQGEPAGQRLAKRRKYQNAPSVERLGPWRRIPGSGWEYFGEQPEDQGE